jgi:hypothetical protein
MERWASTSVNLRGPCGTSSELPDRNPPKRSSGGGRKPLRATAARGPALLDRLYAEAHALRAGRHGDVGLERRRALCEGRHPDLRSCGDGRTPMRRPRHGCAFLTIGFGPSSGCSPTRFFRRRATVNLVRQSMDASRARRSFWCRRGMHESIRPVAGAIVPLALMGVRCFSPYNTIGLEGLVVDQAWKLQSLPTSHQFSPRIQLRPWT